MNLNRFYLYALSIMGMCTVVIGANWATFQIRSVDISFGIISFSTGLVALAMLIFRGPGVPEIEIPYIPYDEEMEA